MKRIEKTLYVDDKNRELFSIKSGVAHVECGYRTFGPSELEELASAASAVAEELRAMESREKNETANAGGLSV